MEFSDRDPRNKPELTLYNRAIKAGWKVARRGWPDFICWKDKAVVCVEVKKSGEDKLDPAQSHVLSLLAQLGVRCYRWDPQLGFQRIKPGNGMPIEKGHCASCGEKVDEERMLSHIKLKHPVEYESWMPQPQRIPVNGRKPGFAGHYVRRK